MATTETLSGITIRPMHPEDVEAVAHIENQAYFAPWPKFAFYSSLAQNYPGFVILDQNEIVGYTLITFVAGLAHVINFVIAPSFQHRGLGKCLLKFLLDFLQPQGLKQISLEVAVNNVAAIRLYETFGFNRLGLRKNYYQTALGPMDALILVRNCDYT